jgi:diacylglycerol kinase family enzyme
MAPVPRALLIVNPFASGVSRERLGRVEAALSRRLDVTTELTRGPGHARELSASAAGAVDAVIVFSGDGTYNEAINGAPGGTPFGFLPGGGASVLVRALGLPRDPAAAAAQVADALAAGRTRSLGLGRVNGRRFSFAAGIGLDAEAVRRVERRGRSAEGRRVGNLAFAATAARVLVEARGRLEPKLELAGHGRAAFVVVACGQPYTYAGPVPVRLAPEGSAGLAFAAPERVAPRTAPGLVVRFVRSSLAHAPGVLSGEELDRLEVRCDEPLPLEADGEDLGDVTEAVFEAERDALSVLV